MTDNYLLNTIDDKYFFVLGIQRSTAPSNNEYIAAWPAYINHRTEYRMVVFESMLHGNEFLSVRAGPLVIRSRSGYVDVINGPRNYKLCNGYACNQRPAVYYTIMAVGKFNHLLTLDQLLFIL